MSEAKKFIVDLGEEISKELNAASDLWTWLPSHQVARAGHGDYAYEYMPDVVDILREAAEFISHGLKPNKKQREEAGDLYKCLCGEEHRIPRKSKSEHRD